MSQDTGAHYRHEYKGLKLDPYRIIDTYGITHPAHQHALKKLLRCGRSIKDLDADIQEVIDSLTRWQEMRKEDYKTPTYCADQPPLEPPRHFRMAVAASGLRLVCSNCRCSVNTIADECHHCGCSKFELESK